MMGSKWKVREEKELKDSLENRIDFVFTAAGLSFVHCF